LNITLIGIDCATQKKKVGLARGEYSHGQVRIAEVVIGGDLDDITGTLARWAQATPTCLLALDAPLGWPAGLRQRPVRSTANGRYRGRCGCAPP
jgi:predicted RNase H-like nuclease